MLKFIEHTGTIVPIDISNIDTDIIIPKQFLQKTNKLGFGKYLFHDWRYLDQNQLNSNPNFILNKTKYKNASILLTRENFGCGSSREHAVWSIIDYGFKAIIAPSFADIFYNNSFNNKLLLITLSDKNIDIIFNDIKKSSIYCTINLLENKIFVANKEYSFKIDSFRRLCLLNNLDEIDLTMKKMKKILFYEKNIPDFLQ